MLTDASGVQNFDFGFFNTIKKIDNWPRQMAMPLNFKWINYLSESMVNPKI